MRKRKLERSGRGETTSFETSLQFLGCFGLKRARLVSARYDGRSGGRHAQITARRIAQNAGFARRHRQFLSGSFGTINFNSGYTRWAVVDRGTRSCGSRRVCPAPDQHGWRQLSNHLSEWPLIERAKQGIAPLEESGVKEGAEGDEDESGDEGED